MPTLQDIIYSVVAGKTARFMRVFLLFLAVVAITIWFDLRGYKNFNTQESMDMAQLARNLSQDRGYTTRFIRPFGIYLVNRQANRKLEQYIETLPQNRALWTLEQQEKVREIIDRTSLIAPHPDIYNPPVYPVVLSWLMRVLPFNYTIETESKYLRYQPELLITIFNQFLFFIAVWMTFSLATRLFEESVGWLVVITLLGSELLWRFSASGLPTMLLLVIFLSLLWTLYLIEKGAEEGLWNPVRMVFLALIAGIIIGVGTLTKYAFAITLVPTLFFIGLYSGLRRGLLSMLAIIGFFMVTVPWFYRNYEMTGSPIGAAGYSIYCGTPSFPGTTLERSLTPDFNKVQASDIPEKLWTNLKELLTGELPFFGGSFIGAFFLAGLVIPFKRSALKRLRQFALLSIICFLIIQALGKTALSVDSPGVNSENLLVLLSPIVFMFGCGFFYMLFEQLRADVPELRSIFIGGFTLLMSAPLLITLLFKPVYPVAYPPYYPPRVYEIGNWMEKNEFIMSDIPWAVAWYGDRDCVWLTINSTQDYETINAHRQIQGLYLTSRTLDGRFLSDWVRGEYEGWGMFILDLLLKREVPTGFPLQKAPTGFFPEQLFLSDKERWIQ
ncbi:MAG: ArnT family glycosyltransferase [Verrucomicrobiia bacterium]|jgi:hypothetical protein